MTETLELLTEPPMTKAEVESILSRWPDRNVADIQHQRDLRRAPAEHKTSELNRAHTRLETAERELQAAQEVEAQALAAQKEYDAKKQRVATLESELVNLESRRTELERLRLLKEQHLSACFVSTDQHSLDGTVISATAVLATDRALRFSKDLEKSKRLELEEARLAL